MSRCAHLQFTEAVGWQLPPTPRCQKPLRCESEPPASRQLLAVAVTFVNMCVVLKFELDYKSLFDACKYVTQGSLLRFRSTTFSKEKPPFLLPRRKGGVSATESGVLAAHERAAQPTAIRRAGSYGNLPNSWRQRSVTSSRCNAHETEDQQRQRSWLGNGGTCRQRGGIVGHPLSDQ